MVQVARGDHRVTRRTIRAVVVGLVLLAAPLAGQGQQARRVPRFAPEANEQNFDRLEAELART